MIDDVHPGASVTHRLFWLTAEGGHLYPFGVGGLTLGYGFVVPYLGAVRLALDGAALSPGGPRVERPALVLLPVALAREASPYDQATSAAVRLRLPVLQDRRIKNELTLGLFIFDDVSLDLHYAAAIGRTDESAGDPRGEVGAALVLGISQFLGVTMDVSIGLGLPVWPGPTDLRDPQLFFTLGVADLAAAL